MIWLVVGWNMIDFLAGHGPFIPNYLHKVFGTPVLDRGRGSKAPHGCLRQTINYKLALALGAAARVEKEASVW